MVKVDHVFWFHRILKVIWYLSVYRSLHSQVRTALYSTQWAWTFSKMSRFRVRDSVLCVSCPPFLMVTKFKANMAGFIVWVHVSEVGCGRSIRKREQSRLFHYHPHYTLQCVRWLIAWSVFPLVKSPVFKTAQGKVPELKRYAIWNRGVPRASRRGQILLAVFYSILVWPIRPTTVWTQGLCLVCVIMRHSAGPIKASRVSICIFGALLYWNIVTKVPSWCCP